MASPYYVRSGAAGAGTGADWTNAYTTLAAAFSGKAAGDVFYVSEDHAETQASVLTLASPGTAAAPCFIYCVNHAGTVPPVSADLRTTGSIATTLNSAINLNNSGYAYYYGLTFSCGSGANAPVLNVANVATWVRFDNCAFVLGGTTGGNIGLGGANGHLVLNGTTVQFASTASQIALQGMRVEWRNTASAIAGATIPTTLFLPGRVGVAIIQGIDLSALGSGKTLVTAPTLPIHVIFIDCKLGASVTITTAPTAYGAIVDLIRADSGATNYRAERYVYQGTQTVETTIVRTFGATDGGTPIAWKIVTTANSKWAAPFELPRIAIWNDSLSAIPTLTFYGTTIGGGVPNNDDIWVEAEYLGSGSTPLGSFITSTKADNLAAAAATNNSSDGSTWGGSGAGNGFKIVVPSFTPAQKGPINLVVKVGKASATYYIDPQPEIAGIPVWRSYALAPGVYANERMIGRGGLHPIGEGLAA